MNPIREVEALLDDERRRQSAPEGARDRVHARLSATLGPGAFSAGGGSSSAGHGLSLSPLAKGSLGLLAAVAISATWYLSGGSEGTATDRRGRGAAPAPSTGGERSGVGLAPRKQGTEGRGDTKEAQVGPAFLGAAGRNLKAPSGPHSTPSGARFPTALRPRESVSSTSRGPSARTDESSPASDSLAAERQLLKEAQRAIRGGDAPRGFDLLEIHEVRFPRGHLVEERRALRVVALERLGRVGEASEARAAFRREFPSSLYPAGSEPSSPIR